MYNHNERLKTILIASVFLCSLIAFFSVSSNAPASENDPPLNGTLSGYVTDPVLDPLVGARVRVHFHETYEEDYTDQTGYYHVTDIPICYCLKEAVASKEGYKTETVWLSITENTIHDFILEPIPLSADTYTIPSNGGAVNFYLNAGKSYANRNYILLGSVSGTSPGTPLPGGLTLPLNWDLLTDFILTYVNTEPFTHFMETFDSHGQGNAELGAYLPLTAFIGVKLYFAYTLYDPFDYVSNPVEIEIVE